MGNDLTDCWNGNTFVSISAGKICSCGMVDRIGVYTHAGLYFAPTITKSTIKCQIKTVTNSLLQLTFINSTNQLLQTVA